MNTTTNPQRPTNLAIIAAAVLVAAGAVLYHTQQPDPADPTPTGDLAANSQPPDDQSDDDLFIETVRAAADDEDVNLDPVSDDQILAVADAVCTDFDTGSSFADVAAAGFAATPDTVDPDDWASVVGTHIGASVAIYCPEHRDAVPDNG